MVRPNRISKYLKDRRYCIFSNVGQFVHLTPLKRRRFFTFWRTLSVLWNISCWQFGASKQISIYPKVIFDLTLPSNYWIDDVFTIFLAYQQNIIYILKRYVRSIVIKIHTSVLKCIFWNPKKFTKTINVKIKRYSLAAKISPAYFKQNTHLQWYC